MGLAASQARFLGITLRKANLEFKSTELAQQRMQLSNQISQISEDYASAINATKLSWQNEAIDGSFGFTYGLLMTPSIANNFNPYMITTKSGAIVLNSSYAKAAEAAGIPMGGVIPTEEGYKKFIYALGDGRDNDANKTPVLKDKNGNPVYGENIISRTTQNILLGMNWHATAGMGAIPKDKSTMNQSSLSDLISDSEIGGRSLDWLQVFRAAKGYTYDDIATNFQYDADLAVYDKAIDKAKTMYANTKISSSGKEVYGMSTASKIYDQAVLATRKNQVGNEWYVDTQTVTINSKTVKQPVFDTSNDAGKILEIFRQLENKIENEEDPSKKSQWQNELEFLKQGIGRNGTGSALDSNTGLAGNPNAKIGPLKIGDNEISADECKVVFPLLWAAYEKFKYQAQNIDGNTGATKAITWDNTIASDTKSHTANADGAGGSNTNSIGFGRLFHIEGDTSIAGGNSAGTKVYKTYSPYGDTQNILANNTFCTMTMYINGSITMNESTIKSLTLGDLLTKDVVIMTQVRDGHTEGASNSDDNEQNAALKTLEVAGEAMLDYIARVFGYNAIGTGLNIDSSTQDALEQAYNMTKRKFLDARGAVVSDGKDDDASALDNDAYLNAIKYNRIGAMRDDDDTYGALNLSNMVSAFLTYFDNALYGAESEYYVGKANEGEGTRTQFVTDDPDYVFTTNTKNALTNEEKINDFYSELYNNICEHGWRADGNLDDYEYLENAIKDGRYALSALNTDGYFYQARYNDVEYIVEESDRDAIARAEADFTRKKAEITSKEDKLDIQTKKLDAEIAELTTELNSVQNLITKSIEKTFAMFSN